MITGKYQGLEIPKGIRLKSISFDFSIRIQNIPIYPVPLFKRKLLDGSTMITYTCK